MLVKNFGTPQGKTLWHQLRERRLGAADPDRLQRDAVTLRTFGRPLSVRSAVGLILERVRKQGDAALLHYLARIEGWKTQAGRVRVTALERRAAWEKVGVPLRRALREAAGHIEQYHRSQKNQRPAGVRRPGVKVAERWLPLRRIGMYVPGGRASLASTVLMNGIPARVAGVKEIVMCTPPDSSGRVAPALLAAADLAGVHAVYRLGGAGAIGAMAFGTETVPRVDKIVGPGNAYVTEAKRQAVGRVGIDSLAGPSEILIVADESARAEWLAWDLLAQSEHGSGAVGILLTPSPVLIQDVLRSIRVIAGMHPGMEAASRSGVLLQVKNLDQAWDLVNEYAPEHLSLQVRRAEGEVKRIQTAGAIFIGSETAQAMGDYTAGPNHVLPTTGTARWASPLSTRDFLRQTSLISYTAPGMKREGGAAVEVAEAEGLRAHAESIRVRIRKFRT